MFFILLLISLVSSHTYPIMYEISTRPWLYELSQKYGKDISKIRDVPISEFAEIKSKGIEIVWMMGVWQLGEYGLNLDKQKDYSNVLPDWTEEDVIGSPYAITQYVCNKEIGTDEDLIWLREELHKLGLKLMLDFVPNHSACDAPEVTSDPTLYVRGPVNDTYDPKYYMENGVAHGKDPYFDPWADTVQWNYFEKKTREVQTKNFVKVAQYADAVRCDMAQLDLNKVFNQTWFTELNYWNYSIPETEFWADAIKEVRKVNPEVVLLAEVYEDWQKEKLVECGFDYYYDKGLIDELKWGSQNVNNYVKGRSLNYFNHSAHMVENHDEERAVQNMGSVARANAAAGIALTLPGMVFLNHGQFDGKKNKLQVHLRRSADEEVSYTARVFYDKLMKIIQDNAFLTDNVHYVDTISGDKKSDFYAMIREKDNHYLVVVNYSNEYGCVDVPIYNIEGDGDVKIRELMLDIELKRNGKTLREKGLTVCMDGNTVHIYQYNY